LEARTSLNFPNVTKNRKIFYAAAAAAAAAAASYTGKIEFPQSLESSQTCIQYNIKN
jgi:hypothetical protein